MKNVIAKAILVASILVSTACGEQYKVDNFEHGVVICEARSIMINLGHEDDPQIKELFDQAKKCSNYKED